MQVAQGVPGTPPHQRPVTPDAPRANRSKLFSTENGRRLDFSGSETPTPTAPTTTPIQTITPN